MLGKGRGEHGDARLMMMHVATRVLRKHGNGEHQGQRRRRLLFFLLFLSFHLLLEQMVHSHGLL